MEFGQRIRLVRVARDMSQRQVQDASGIDTRYISEIETGKILATPEWEQRLREAVGLTPEVDTALDALADALGVDHGAAAGGQEAA